MTMMFPGDDGSPDGALRLTEQLFGIAVADLNDALAAIREGRADAAKEGKRAVQQLADLSVRVLEERRNVEKLRKQTAGAVGTWGELDLDAARDEIGLRLACLRNARGD